MTELLYGNRQLPRLGFFDVIPEAFRQDNDVVNLFQLATANRPPLDPNFNVQEAAARLGDSQFWLRNMSSLAGAQSQQEFDGTTARIRQQEEDRARLAQAGWGGFFASMTAGTMSPTMFIPLVGQARGARGVAQAFGLAALGATASELPLLANQETRTVGETFMGIAAGTVLGGLLGSTAVYFRRADFDRVARDLDPEVDTQPRAMLVRTAEGGIVREGEQVSLRGLEEPVRRSYEVYRNEVEVSVPMEGLTPAPSTSRGVTFFTDSAPAVRQAVDGAVNAMMEILPERIEMANPREVDFGGRVLAPEESARLVEAAQRAGHDGLVVRNAVDPVTGQLRTTYAVFDEAQVRAPDEPANPLATREDSQMNVGGESTAGARETRGMNIPGIEVVDSATGVRTWEPIASADEVLSMDPALRIGEIAARINPIARLVMQWGAPVRSRVAARVGLRLSDGGISWRGSDYGMAPAKEGTVEARLQYYEALKGRAYKELYDAYSEYINEGVPQGVVGRAQQFARVETNRAPAGKMPFREFSAAVTESLNRGDVSPVPQIARVAQFWRKNVYNEVLRAAQDAADEWGAERLFKEAQFDQQHSYMTHVYSPSKVATNQSAFIEMVSDYINEATRATWKRRLEKARRKADQDMSAADLLTMDGEEARRMFDENAAMLQAMKEDADPRVGQIRQLRTEARDLVTEKVEELRRQQEMHAGSFVTENGQKRYIHKMSDRELRAHARAEVADARQALLDEAEALEGQLPRDVLADVDEAARLRRMNRTLAKSFGKLEEKQAAALARIEENEALNLSGFQRVVQATQKFMKDSARLNERDFEAEVAKLQTAWEKAYTAARRGEERLDKLEEDLLFGEYTGKGALQESMQQTGRQMRASGAFDRLSAAMLRDRPAMMAELQSRLDASITYTNKVNSKRSERNALLRQRLESLDPEQAKVQAQRIRDRVEQRFEGLDERLMKAGGMGNVREGAVDFSDASRDYATALANRIMGNTARLAQIDAAVGMRGPMKGRHLNIPYHNKKQFLEEDSEKVLDRYLMTMGSDIELFRAFGDRSGSKAIIDVMDDLQRIREGIEARTDLAEGPKLKMLKAHDKATKSRIQELEGTIERIRGLRGMPDNPNAIPYRIGRFTLNMNVATMLGSAALSSIPDAARTVFAHGMNRTLRDSWMPYIRSMSQEADRKLTKAQRRELQMLGIGIDSFTHQRARNMLDILDPMSQGNKLEKGMEWAAQKTPVFGLLGAWTDAMKVMTGSATMARMSSALDAAMTGTAKQDDIKYLAQAGIDGEMVGRIHGQMQDHGTKYGDLTLPNTESWTDYTALRVYMAAMAREDARLVVSPGLEKPLWLDASMLGRILGQFRSFTMASNSKILVGALQARGDNAIYAAHGAMLSLGLGAVSYYIWAMTNNDRSRTEMRNASWEVWLDQAIYRSGLLGVFSEAQNIGQEFGLTRPFVRFSGQELAGRRADNALGAAAGPSFGKAMQITSFLQGLDEPTEGTVRQARRLIPWQNIFYLRRGFDLIEQGVSSTLGLPENRR